MQTERRDGVADFKRWRQDFQSDGVMDLVTASGPSNWFERLPAGTISTWEDLTTRFLAEFFPLRRNAKLRNDILIFHQHQRESLSEAWTRFKDFLLKVPHHGLDLWLQVQIFYDYVDYTTQMAIDFAAGGRLRKLNPKVAWETIEDLAQYEEEG
ncbi:zinc finger, CCHC-type containing protein [Tanacetum coccineum]